jgi:hypothetical protein
MLDPVLISVLQKVLSLTWAPQRLFKTGRVYDKPSATKSSTITVYLSWNFTIPLSVQISNGSLFSGTFGGAMYANKYPENVGRFALDAVFAPGLVCPQPHQNLNC